MDARGDSKRVAIAYQGGGSHMAFTAGALKRLLGAEELKGHEVVGLSGTSGGPVCALLAWHYLLRGDRVGAEAALDAFWRDNSASAPHEQIVNHWIVWASNLQNFVAMPAISPYDNYFSGSAADEFRRMHGGTYWDGLFSQNPPVRELTDEGPDEIWVIQINPKELGTEPRTVVQIADRRNELSGNLSLHQELHSIEKIDQLLEEGLLSREGKYKQIVVRVIELSRSRFSRSLGTASKLNRDPGFIRDLMEHGEAQAEEFLAALAFEDAWKYRDADAVMGFFAEDAELVSSAPFLEAGSYKGREQIQPFVAKHMAEEVRVDLTKKQVARDGVAWTVRGLTDDGRSDRSEGTAEGEFREGKIKALHLSAGT